MCIHLLVVCLKINHINTWPKVLIQARPGQAVFVQPKDLCAYLQETLFQEPTTPSPRPVLLLKN